MAVIGKRSAAAPKGKKKAQVFTIDCTKPVEDKIMEIKSFEKFLMDKIKVDNKTGAPASGGGEWGGAGGGGGRWMDGRTGAQQERRRGGVRQPGSGAVRRERRRRSFAGGGGGAGGERRSWRGGAAAPSLQPAAGSGKAAPRAERGWRSEELARGSSSPFLRGDGGHTEAVLAHTSPPLTSPAPSYPLPPQSPGVLGDNVKVSQDKGKVTVTSEVAMSKRYLKYLTKKYLKKYNVRDWLRVIASSKKGEGRCGGGGRRRAAAAAGESGGGGGGGAALRGEEWAAAVLALDGTWSAK